MSLEMTSFPIKFRRGTYGRVRRREIGEDKKARAFVGKSLGSIKSDVDRFPRRGELGRVLRGL